MPLSHGFTVYEQDGLRVTRYADRTGPFTVDGVTYLSLFALNQAPTTASASRLYPCFDAFDRMHEDRYFRWSFPCASIQEADALQQRIAQGTVRLAQLSDPQYDFAWGEYARVPVLPMVYAEDGEDWLIVLEPA